MSGYHYGPPPPPPASGPRKPDEYYGYSTGASYASAPPAQRGGSFGHNYAGSSGGRGGHYQGPSVHHPSDHNRLAKEPVPGYPDRPFNPAYGAPQQNNYWQGNSQMNQSRNAGPSSTFPPNGYAFQGYQQPPPPQEFGYPSQAPHQPYAPAYTPPQHDYQSQQWGRGGYQGDRGGHKSDHAMGPPIRIGFDRPGGHSPHNAGGSGYGHSYPPSHPPAPYPQPLPYSNQPPVPVNPPLPSPAQFSGQPSTRGHYGSNSRGQGRNNFGHFNKSRPFNNNAGGEKFRHNQRPHHGAASPVPHKPDQSSFKKKKRKTNTLGLTPGDGDESDQGPADEEAYWVQKLGNELPAIPNMAAWLAERKANFPTQKRVQEKKKAEALKAAQASSSTNGTSMKIDSDEEKLGKLQAEMNKVERRLKEKRKRSAQDEGDDMRHSDSLSAKSEDEAPESLTTRKPASLPPPPIVRADPSSHCKYYATGGKCGKKDKCRFKHDPAVREAALQEQTRNGGRLTLKQRLMLNDKNMEDRETVEAIISLRSNGRILDPQNPEISRERYSIQTSSTLPTAPGLASLPPNPITSAHSSETQHVKPKKEYATDDSHNGFGYTGSLPSDMISTYHQHPDGSY